MASRDLTANHQGEPARVHPALLLATPSQTAGPYVSIGTEWAADGLVVAEGSPGRRLGRRQGARWVRRARH